MSRKILSAIAMAAFFAGLAAGCGGSGNGGDVQLADLLPASGEVSGWTENTDRGEAGPEATQSVDTATLWVDGAMDGFVQSGGWVGLAREFYSNGDLEIELYVHEWEDAASATTGYTGLATYHGDDIPTWNDVSLGAGEAGCHMGQVGSFYYLLDAHKSKFLVELTVAPATGEGAEQAAQDFAAAVVAKIP